MTGEPRPYDRGWARANSYSDRLFVDLAVHGVFQMKAGGILISLGYGQHFRLTIKFTGKSNAGGFLLFVEAVGQHYGRVSREVG